ncbi:hypothetical protein GCM10020000_37290 [Streptomyces olivoverticillatus]
MRVLGPSHALKRRARTRPLCALGAHREREEVEHCDGHAEERGRQVRAQGGLVRMEPADARAEQIAEERDDDERGGRHGQRHEGRTQRQAPQRLVVVRQGPDGRALGRCARQQRGERAVLGDRPDAFGDPDDEGRDQQPGERLVAAPVDPGRGHGQQREPYAVRTDHGPAPVERTGRREERGERAQQDCPEEQRRDQPRTDDGGHGERGPPVAPAERTRGRSRLERQQQEHQHGQGVPDATGELGAPQPPQRREAQQGPDGTLAGVRG